MQVEEANQGQKLIFKLDGFNSSLGAGSSKPLFVGQLNKKELYFAFDVAAYDSESTKKITYTFYLGDDIK